MTAATVPESTARTLSRAVLLRDQKVASFRDSCRALVARCARGDEVAPEAILKSLDHWGIPVEQFQDDVELLIRRTELRADFDAGAAAQNTIYAIIDLRSQAEAERDAAIARANSECETAVAQAKAKHNASVEPLVEQERIALAARDRAGEAQTALRESSSPEARAEHTDARKALDAAQRDIAIHVHPSSGANAEADRLGRELVKLRSRLSHASPRDPVMPFTWDDMANRDALQARIAEVNKQIDAARNRPSRSPDPELVAALAEAEKRLAVATENLLIP